MRVVLRDAIGLAIALNRTLVLPRMLCYCDNIWKEMKHCRVGGAFGMTLPFDCPADHIIQLVSWYADSVPIAFREPGFLTDPRLAPEIRSSWKRLVVPPMSGEQAARALRPYDSVRVLELSAAHNRFCGFESTRAASQFATVARQLVPYSRHFCYEDGFKVGPGGIPFYSPCCHGAPGRHFPCKYLVSPPQIYSEASQHPPFCTESAAVEGVREESVPASYPDLSPNPGSRQFHKVVDDFRAKTHQNKR